MRCVRVRVRLFPGIHGGTHICPLVGQCVRRRACVWGTERACVTTCSAKYHWVIRELTIRTSWGRYGEVLEASECGCGFQQYKLRMGACTLAISLTRQQVEPCTAREGATHAVECV
jgi:hypothetical protein